MPPLLLHSAGGGKRQERKGAGGGIQREPGSLWYRCDVSEVCALLCAAESGGCREDKSEVKGVRSGAC